MNMFAIGSFHLVLFMPVEEGLAFYRSFADELGKAEVYCKLCNEKFYGTSTRMSAQLIFQIDSNLF